MRCLGSKIITLQNGLVTKPNRACLTYQNRLSSRSKIF
ncbi:hypothetical protein SPHINGO8AM_330003 [Sphingomonas sp. 8AM]|nr:hypothetical protein SPHINGO8AM_330003 [Sphingomonas sp. 8AM]